MIKVVLRTNVLMILVALFFSCRDEEIQKKEETVYTPEKESTRTQRTDSIDSLPADSIPQDSTSLPKDTTAIDSTTFLPLDSSATSGLAGKQIPYYLNADKNIYGHYIYFPKDYKEGNSEDHPLIIFLHGMGERGNSKVNKTELPRVLRNGVPALINKGKWKDDHSALVVSPQCHDGSWHPDKLHKFIEYIVANYPIDKSRIYLTGLSMGGFGTFEYLGAYGDDSYVAAAVAIAGGGHDREAASFHNIPVWAFHGQADNVVNVKKSIKMVDAINKANPVHKALLTIYPNVGHVSWTMTYDDSGMGKESKDYDPFNENVIDWMFKFRK